MNNRLFLFCLLAVFATSCVNELQDDNQDVYNAPVFYATIEQAGEPSTKVFADDSLRVLWNADDRVSIFNKTTFNREYRFEGQDGANSGTFERVPSDKFVASNPLNYVYSVYPYNENTSISNDGEITVYLPAEQTYREDSFGLGANTMIAITEDDELMFKNLCGYFAIKLYGDNVSVSSITLRGNNNEYLAGKATVVAQMDAAPTIQFDAANATKELTLTCATPVTIGTTAETATTFWFVIPPTVFENGISLTVKENRNGVFKKTTSGRLEINRNTLKSSAPLLVIPEPSDDPIQFADPIAKYACVEKFDTDGDGEVSYAEAAAATSLSGLFTDWKTVTSFEEIRYFTGVTSTSGVFTGLNKLTHITIPDNITTLGTFQGCTALETVVLPEALASLPTYCFDGCTSLTDVTLPTGLIAIPNYAFRNCTALTTLDVPSTLTSIGQYAFSGCNVLTGIDMPSGLKTIESYAFQNCKAIPSVEFPASLTTIGSYAFSGCTVLSSVVLPEDMTSIPAYCFQNCTALASVTWPTALTNIGNYAFDGCSFKAGNYALRLPETVTTIGSNAFGYLRHLILPSASPVSIQSYSFKTNYTFLYVPAGMVEMYKVRTNWSRYAERIRPIGDYPVQEEVGGTVGEAVDLGLSVKWASWNIGASAPEEYGAYFAWGETAPKLLWGYSVAAYYWCDGSYSSLTKYNTNSSYGTVDNKTTLDPEDDAAHVNWGGNWRMPTDAEWTELMNNCTWTWTTVNGVYGRLVTSNKEGYTNKSIFLPAAGFGGNTGSGGSYWSSSLDTGDPRRARYVFFESVGVYRGSSDGRYNGLSVRPVCE